MKTSRLLAVVVMACLAIRVMAGQVPAFAGDAKAAVPVPQAPARPATVGGGVYHPWTPPYMVALMGIHREPSSFAMISLSGIVLMVLRRGQKREHALARI